MSLPQPSAPTNHIGFVLFVGGKPVRDHVVVSVLLNSTSWTHLFCGLRSEADHVKFSTALVKPHTSGENKWRVTS